jgi:hypothetical protein
MLKVIAGKAAQDGFSIRRARAQRTGVFDHLIVLLMDQLPIDRL